MRTRGRHSGPLPSGTRSPLAASWGPQSLGTEELLFTGTCSLEEADARKPTSAPPGCPTNSSSFCLLTASDTHTCSGRQESRSHKGLRFGPSALPGCRSHTDAGRCPGREQAALQPGAMGTQLPAFLQLFPPLLRASGPQPWVPAAHMGLPWPAPSPEPASPCGMERPLCPSATPASL